MAPLTESFPPSQLPSRINTLPTNKARKPPLKLEDCELKEMLQYSCQLDGTREDPGTRVVCEPVLRMFRKCANGVTVETTSWEGMEG